MARRSRPWLMLVLALASGGTAAFLALRYLNQQSTPVLAETKRSQVVVAARELPVGAVVTPEDVRLVEWTGALPLGFISTPEEVVGRGLVTPVTENEPLLAGKLAPPGVGGGLQVKIIEGMRAMSLPVNDVVGVAGFVLPGTRVDVLLTMEASPGSSEAATRLLLQNVRTLAAGQTIQQDKDGRPLSVPVVTFLVTPEQAETLTLASTQGRIQLALRNTLDSTEIRTPGTRVSALMGGAIGRPVRPAGPRRAPTPREPASDRTVVEVYKGGERTLMRF